MKAGLSIKVGRIVCAVLAAILLVVAQRASASHLLPSGRLWVYYADFSNAPLKVWDLSTDAVVVSFVPRNGNGRGVAYDPTDGNIWNSTLFAGKTGDGLIHKNPPLGGPDVRTIPEPGGAGGPGIGALDYDPEENVLWAATHLPVAGQASFYKLRPSDGAVLKTCTMTFQGGDGNDTLAVARPGDLGGAKVLLTDAGDWNAPHQLFAIDVNTCAVLKTYALPVGITGIDVDDATGNLILSDSINFYNLGPAPYSTILATMAAVGDAEDISLGPAATALPKEYIYGGSRLLAIER